MHYDARVRSQPLDTRVFFFFFLNKIESTHFFCNTLLFIMVVILTPNN